MRKNYKSVDHYAHDGEGLLVEGEEGVLDHVHVEDCPGVEDSCQLLDREDGVVGHHHKDFIEKEKCLLEF